ncbi:hypothetical protein A2U01_0042160, partial [Trifolium medium]|nr:hypothetical protein [Trifolium medium]
SPRSCANSSLYLRKIFKPLTLLFNLLSPNPPPQSPPPPPPTTTTNVLSPLTLPLATAAAAACQHLSSLFNSHVLSLSHLLQ